MQNIENPLKNFFGTFTDDKSKEFLEYIMQQGNNMQENDENIRTMFDFFSQFQKNMNFESNDNDMNYKEEQDLDDLVRQKKYVNSKIANLSEDEQTEFWAKYHEIPTDKDVNNKLDVIAESIQILNKNFTEFSNEVCAELAILRNHMK